MVTITTIMSHQASTLFRPSRRGSILRAAAIITATLSFASVANADVVYPASPTITKDGTTILLENYANAPFSFRTLTVFPPVPNYNDQLSRINFMRAEPTNAPGFGSRFFVCDLNRNLYIVPKTNPSATNTWIKYLTLENIFPRFDNDPGFAGGQTTFAFDPEYAANGLFYTVHMETTAATLGPTNGAYPNLDLTGYTTTTAINPPSGTVGRIAVLIEWRDTNVSNTTFEGTAREVLRLGFFGTIHPLGDLLYNPNATPGHPDYRNLYIAVGDGRSGETAGTTHNHPQQMNAFPGKIIRITPDLTLRPADELSSNGRYRIPTTGTDPNPFASPSGTFTNVTGLRKEIFAYGFRNPHRMSWDAVSSNLFVCDIGLNSWEEVNIIHKGDNYGWAEREGPEQMLVSGTPAGLTGSQQTVPVAFPAVDLLTVTGFVAQVSPIYPVAVYSSRDGDAISSGFVYRGTLMPSLYGKFIFGDITTARLLYCDLNEMLAADDGNRATQATIKEIQVAFNSPYDAPDQGVTNRRLFDIVSEAYKQKGGTNANALPGGASVTSLTGTNMPGGVPFGGGRADIRLAVGDDDEIYIISKSDASIRKMTAVLGPPTISSIVPGGGDVTINFQSFPGRKYRAQFKDALTDPTWTDVSGDVTASGFAASKTTAMTNTMQFFRMRLLP
jgi:Glucose / Sorbosone dehydrogenase